MTNTLQRILDLAPDGATIRLTPGATYRVDGTLRLDRRTGLVIEGRGATLHPTTIADFERRTWSVIDSTDITIRDIGIVGAHPDGGTYVPEHEHEHGFAVQGGGGVTIELARVSSVYGDCLYVAADDAGVWADGVRFMDSSCTATGRNGVAVVAGKNVEVARSSFSKIALFPLDVEPNHAQHLEGASGISFHDNRIAAPVGDYVVAANGWGPIDHLTVTGNLVTGIPFLLTVHPLDGSGYRRAAIAITGNRSDTSPIGNDPVMDFADNDGLTVTGNAQRFLDGGVFAHVTGSCEVEIAGNIVDKATEAVIEPNSCP